VNKQQAEIFIFSAARIDSPLYINLVSSCVNGFFFFFIGLFVPFEFLSHFFVQIQNGLNIVLYC